MIDREHLLATLRGALKSLTVWASGLLFVLPDLIPMVQANFATVAPFIPEELHSQILKWLALLMLLLRLRTNASLAQKGQKPPTQ